MTAEVFVMAKRCRTFIVCLAVPLLVGGLSAFLTRGGTEQFSMLNKPPLTPPAWLFPVVWIILYILMGIASYLVLVSGEPDKIVRMALAVYALQLGFNFLWPVLFFNLGWYLFAFFWLLFLEFLILLAAFLFFSICPAAGRLMIPYVAWVAFAGYLNLAVWYLNRLPAA